MAYRRNNHQNKDNQNPGPSSLQAQLDRLQARERQLRNEIAFETSQLQLPLKELLLSLFSTSYRRAKLYQKEQRIQRIRKLNVDLAHVQSEITSAV